MSLYGYAVTSFIHSKAATANGKTSTLVRPTNGTTSSLSQSVSQGLGWFMATARKRIKDCIEIELLSNMQLRPELLFCISPQNQG